MIARAQTLYITFDDRRCFRYSAELLRVESPSVDVVGHDGVKVTVPGKKRVKIMRLEPTGNYAVRYGGLDRCVLRAACCLLLLLLLSLLLPSLSLARSFWLSFLGYGGRQMLRPCIVVLLGYGRGRIVFDDFHDTGIYAWSYLYELGAHKLSRSRAYLRALQQQGLSRNPLKQRPHIVSPHVHTAACKH